MNIIGNKHQCDSIKIITFSIWKVVPYEHRNNHIYIYSRSVCLHGRSSVGFGTAELIPMSKIQMLLAAM